MVLIKSFFQSIELFDTLKRCFRSGDTGAYPTSKLFLLLIVHLMLGFRRLRSMETYAEDPMAKDLVGLAQLPAISTWSERINACPEHVLEKLAKANRSFVFDELSAQGVDRLTLDFDGSVIGTRRRAEDSAVGFNRKRKGQRSYYPLFCTVAQSGQVVDTLYRSGNVHDSNGAVDFMASCIHAAKEQVEGAAIEMRMDSAFFNEEILSSFEDGIEFTASVAFMRFDGLKEKVEHRKRWRKLTPQQSYFEIIWRPECWEAPPVRLLILRQRVAKQRKGPLQLDLFEPVDYEYDYSVVATNKTLDAETVIDFHHGRGSQEGVLGELKNQMNMGLHPIQKTGWQRAIPLGGNLGSQLIPSI